MKNLTFISAALIVFATSSVAQDCPDAPDHTSGVADLIAEIQQAESEAAAKAISNQLWELWTDAPDEWAQTMLDRGMSRRESWDLLGALKEFNTLVEYCPEYAEGYNQRAFVNYLRHDFAASLKDLDAAIELSPNHVAALSGRALALLGLKRVDEARDALSKALLLNPWLPERTLLDPGGLLDPPGKDI
ncbi:MAG: tetratricopeptide repeat protein [Ruegeria sp.]